MPLSNIPRRRAVRAALVLPAAAGLLGGCSDGTRPGGTSAKGSPSVDAGVALRGRAARDSAALLARYDATIAAHPDLARRLQPLRAEVALHAEAFGASGTRLAVHRAFAVAGVTGPRSAHARPAEALAALVTRPNARSPTRREVAALRGQAPAELARLLASVAACGAGHVLLLKEH